MAQLPDVTSVDRCGHFHLNAAHIVIAVWEHLLVDKENQVTDGEVSTREAPFLPCLKCR